MNRKLFFYTSKQAHVEHSTDAPVIAVKAFERGYYPIHTRATADDLNAQRSHTPEVLESALAASMFGWDCPAARPAYDYVIQIEMENGRPA